MKDIVHRFRKFIIEDIWKVSLNELSQKQYFLIKGLRIIVLAIRGFIDNACVQKASGLTYYSLISVVPIAAMAFGIAKGFGFEQSLEAELQKQFAGHQEIVVWIMDFAIKYLDSVKGGMIAGVGFAILMWSMMKVLGFIEDSFNDIWEVKRPRSFVRKFSDYLSLMMVALLFLISSSSMIVFVRQEMGSVYFGGVAGAFLGYVIPYLLIWIVFTMMFVIMPNTRVKFSSALVGGIISGTLFQLLQYYYIHFQIGVSSYNAIYGSFAAFPLFLIWLNTSWMIVLFGSELAYATQNVRNFEYESDTKSISYNYKRQVYLIVAQFVAKRFYHGEKAPTTNEIAFDLKLPIRLVTDIIFELTECGILSEISIDEGKESAFQPAMDVHKLKICTVLNRLEEKGSSDFLVNNKKLSNLRHHLSKMHELSDDSEHNKLLIDF
jgi:membrane protein